MVPDISVVVPTFRRPALLEEALESILSQEASVEVIVVDDSPERSARPVAEARAARGVRYVEMDPPTGGKPALVRNRGAREARGRLLHLLDDDDVVLPGAYASVLRAAAAHPEAGVFIASLRPFGPDPASVERERGYFAAGARRAARAPHNRFWLTLNLLLLDTFMVNSAGFLRREAFEALGGYDPLLPLNEDVEFFQRAVRRFGARWLGEELIGYRVGNASLMHGEDGKGQGDEARLRAAYVRMHQKYKDTNGAAEFYALKLLARLLVR